MENENLAKSNGKDMGFCIFKNAYHIFFEKNMLIN